MRVHSSTDYALRALIELVAPGNQVLSAETIGRRQNIPPRFLQAILADLHKAGLVDGVRGHGGGWRLSRDPSTITVTEVVRATNGPLVNVSGSPPEEGAYNPTTTALQSVWIAARSSLQDVFDTVTIRDLADDTLPEHVRTRVRREEARHAAD